MVDCENSKLVKLFQKKSVTDYRPSFSFERTKKRLHSQIFQFRANLDGESLQHFASVSDHKTSRKNLGCKILPSKNVFLFYPTTLVYPVNSAKRTRNPAIKAHTAMFSGALNYSEMWFNGLLDNILGLGSVCPLVHALRENPGFKIYKVRNFRLNYFKKTKHALDYHWPQEHLMNVSSILASYSKAYSYFTFFFNDSFTHKREYKEEKFLNFFNFGFLSLRPLSQKIRRETYQAMRFRRETRLYRKHRPQIVLKPFGLDVPDASTLTANWKDYEKFHITQFDGIWGPDGKPTPDTIRRVAIALAKVRAIVKHVRP